MVYLLSLSYDTEDQHLRLSSSICSEELDWIVFTTTSGSVDIHWSPTFSCKSGSPAGREALYQPILNYPTSIGACWVIAGLEIGLQPGWHWLGWRTEARSLESLHNWRVCHEWERAGKGSPYSTRCCCHSASSSAP